MVCCRPDSIAILCVTLVGRGISWRSSQSDDGRLHRKPTSSQLQWRVLTLTWGLKSHSLICSKRCRIEQPGQHPSVTQIVAFWIA